MYFPCFLPHKTVLIKVL